MYMFAFGRLLAKIKLMCTSAEQAFSIGKENMQKLPSANAAQVLIKRPLKPGGGNYG
ncbi:hypothetical protein J15TS10_51950 [Paenibacillus woosongensis]|uniref:Uncharacterized protein n=1 Tax=Paenibacillus woosongensis TaxID=307580 RepID=A0ABQ4MZS8_9BACL|nr:hypothetical protein J15TS10_51950 [Paenibacillus woosongensis]